MNATGEATRSRLTSKEIKELDPYMMMGMLGKRVIHPGGRRSTEELFQGGDFQRGQQVLDIGCGVGTTAIEIARRFGAHVVAADISPLMLTSTRANVRRARLENKVEVRHADIVALPFEADTFDRVVAEAVTMFVDRAVAARELVRVCKPGGKVLTTEFLWRKPPTQEAKHIFLGEICPGMMFDDLDDWVRIYSEAGLTDVQVTQGPFEMMTPKGFLSDEGLGNSLAVMGRAMSRPAYMKKMMWLMPRMNRAVPYLGYITIAGIKPAVR
jgi:SAM-dependent methyltransferase